MARRKKDEVSMDEVREEIAQAPVAGEDATEEIEGEGQAEDGAAEDQGEPTAADLGVGGVDDPIKIVNDTKHMMIALTEHELVDKAQLMVQALDEAQREQKKLKSMQSAVKARVDAAREIADECKTLIRRGEEERLIEVQQIHNWADMKVYTRRVDTGEILEVRPMAQWERQMPIPGSGQAEPEADAADEAQADSDPDEIEIEYSDDGELAGVGAGDDEREGEV